MWQHGRGHLAGAAFGGLVPQASLYVNKAVSSTVGSTERGSCIDGLENFLNNFHDLHTGLDETKLAGCVQEMPVKGLD
jgi:hypothetical protein